MGFRAAFEQVVPRGGFAVVTRGGLPTTPVHGADGQQVEADYSIDVKNGDWKPSTGFTDFNQVQTSTLAQGELMEVVDVTFKDGSRIDLLEVMEALGKPQSEVSSGSRSKWTYPALTVVFENGRVKEVQF